MKTFLRVLIALGIALFWITFTPQLAGMAFGPCDVLPQSLFELNCVNFLGFIWGFGFVLIWLVVTPARTALYILGLLLLVMLSVVGEVRNGLEVLQSAAGWQLIIERGYPILLGGLMALGMCSVIHSVVKKNRQADHLSDR